eukprot:3543918-Prymnesium_polylepis.2
MLEVFMSLDHAQHRNRVYSTLGTYNLVCGRLVAGYRVPVPTSKYTTYDTFGIDVHNFAPVVAYGSLEAMRSSFSQLAYACPDGYAPESAAQAMFCGRLGIPEHQMLIFDAEDRVKTSPVALQNRIVSVKALHKQPRRSCVVPRRRRSEENVDFVSKSLQAWAFITSSAEPRVAPGFHRLIDLPVLVNENCNKLPNAICSASGMRINTGTTYQTQFEVSATFHTGRNAITKHRCSSAVEAAVNRYCDRAPYASSGAGCYTGDLDLVERPKLYSSAHWFSTLVNPSPTPPPSPLTPPHSSN